MKKIAFIFNFLLAAITLIAQVPAGFNYQVVVRNNSGEVIANQAVKFKISIIQNSPDGDAVYIETHSVTTNEFGLANLVIGEGVYVEGIFSPVGWGLEEHFLKVELDPAGGSTFVHLGTTQLLSVPYAFHAQTVEEEEDGDPANEIQSLSISGTNLTLSQGGGTVPLPAGDNWGTDYVHTDVTLAGQGTTSTPLKIAQQSATTGQVLKWNGSTWLPGADLSGSSLWSQNGSNIFYNTGKVGIGKDPGSDSRQFQVIGGTNAAIAGNNSSASYPTIYAENSTDGGFAARFVNKSGPVVRFERNIIINDGTQGSGKVLTSDANGKTSWETPSSNPWQTVGSNIYYNSGWVGIGTSSILYPLSIENANNTCYIKLKDNQGTGGMRIGAYTGELALINDNQDRNIHFTVKNSTGYKELMTLDGLNNRVGINTTTPSATLDVEGTVVIGSSGKVFSEISEITGTTGTGGHCSISYPSGYTMSNIRVLSLEVNYNGTGWVGIGSNQSNTEVTPRLFYYLGSTNIMIYYQAVPEFQSKKFRMMVMKVQ